jgi:hypothetical protein
MRDEPYACGMHTRFGIPPVTPEDADTTYHTRESSPWTINVSPRRGRGNDARRSPKSMETDIFPSSMGGTEEAMGRDG